MPAAAHEVRTRPREAPPAPGGAPDRGAAVPAPELSQRLAWAGAPVVQRSCGSAGVPSEPGDSRAVEHGSRGDGERRGAKSPPQDAVASNVLPAWRVDARSPSADTRGFFHAGFGRSQAPGPIPFFLRDPGGGERPAFRGRWAAASPVAALTGSGGGAEDSSAGSPAAVRDGVAAFRPDALTGPRGREIEAHEAVHAAQWAATRAGAPPGTRTQLEADAARGSRVLLSGRPYAPRVSAPAGSVLTFETATPFVPVQATEVPRNAASLATLGSGAERTGSLDASTSRANGADGRVSIAYHLAVHGAGARGGVNTVTDLSVEYDPGNPVGTGLGPVVIAGPEIGLAPRVPVPLYPVQVGYRRTLSLHDADGRKVFVQVVASVAFTRETWARELGGQAPTFETLLQLHGDKSWMTVQLVGEGPVQPYLADYANTGSSLGIQSSVAEAQLPLGAGILPFTSSIPARFIRPELTAGEQFDSLEAFLVAADAIELARRLRAAASQPAVGWLEEVLTRGAAAIAAALADLAEAIADLWNALPEAVRGVLAAIGKFAVGLGIVLGAAAVIVEFFPAVAFGAAALAVGAVLLAVAFGFAAVSRTLEALEAGIYDPNAILAIALLDAVGVTTLIEAITDQSVLTGRELGRTTEERWEAGTTGVLQIIAIIAGVLGMRGARSSTAEPGPPVPPSGEMAPEQPGLHTRGFRPPPGTRVRPAGIPDAWRIVPTKGEGGVRYFDPRNPGNAVRVMPGDPNSAFPNSRTPYVRWQRNGQALDVNGRVVSKNSPDAHIPLADFRFDPSLFP